MHIRGNDVYMLERFMNYHDSRYPNSKTLVAQSGPGSPTNEQNIFTTNLKKALTNFQNYHADELLVFNTATASGYFGAITRQKVNNMCNNEFNVIEQIQR